jgi:AcrR family transcriptional regulator
MTDPSEKILEAALKLYTSKPPQSVSMEEIANEAGVSKGTIFYHFKNKNNLERELIKYSVEKYFSWVYEETRDSRTLEKIVRESLKIVKENPRITLLWYYVFEKELFSGNTEFARKLCEEMLGFLTLLLKDMGVNKPEQTAIVLMAMLDGISIYSLFIPELDLDEIGNLILEFVKGRCKK